MRNIFKPFNTGVVPDTIHVNCLFEAFVIAFFFPVTERYILIKILNVPVVRLFSHFSHT